eukprot:scaffold689600_cov71-Attheya_sp.AAC.1
MEKSQVRRDDHWVSTWKEDELVQYGTLVGIQGIEEIVSDNMVHIGGVPRYAFTAGAAKRAVNVALSKLNAQALHRLMTVGIQAKDKNRKFVDRLLHYHDEIVHLENPEAPLITFASEYVASRVAQVSQLRVAFAGSYLALKLSEGGSFETKNIAGDTTNTTERLDIPKTTIYQKPTKVLNKTNFPPDDIRDKIVWPNPEHNLPAIDMLAFLTALEACMGFQMTVSITHSLNLNGMKAAIKYFNSVCRELTKTKLPGTYRFYFAVPDDIYQKFSKHEQAFTDKAGK